MKCKVTTKNSLVLKKLLKISFVLGWACCLSIMFPVQSVFAQMFSVGDSGPTFNQPMSEIHLGLELMDVNYEGAPESEIGPEAGAFEFSGPIARMGYNNPGINLFMGAGGAITGIDDASYFDVGGDIDFGIQLYRSEKLRLQLPFRIASRYTNITNNQRQVFTSISRFQFGSLAAGIGGRILARPQKDIRIEAIAVPSYGFSFASGGFFGGSIGQVKASSKLYFDRLIGDKGLSLGYSYNFRNYDIDDEVYDYSMNGHTLELGVTF